MWRNSYILARGRAWSVRRTLVLTGLSALLAACSNGQEPASLPHSDQAKVEDVLEKALAGIGGREACGQAIHAASRW